MFQNSISLCSSRRQCNIERRDAAFSKIDLNLTMDMKDKTHNRFQLCLFFFLARAGAVGRARTSGARMPIITCAYLNDQKLFKSQSCARTCLARVLAGLEVTVFLVSRLIL